LAEDAGRVASLKKLVVGDFGMDSAWQKMLEEWPLWRSCRKSEIRVTSRKSENSECMSNES
jgi:hypothetical protein